MPPTVAVEEKRVDKANITRRVMQRQGAPVKFDQWGMQNGQREPLICVCEVLVSRTPNFTFSFS